MSKHHNSKLEPEIASEAVVTVPPRQVPAGDVETARLAYSYWEARGCTNGSADEDWIRAEQELRSLRL